MILAIIQARMGSTRLPGKVLMKLSGVTVIEHVLNRVSNSRYINETIVATSIESNNLPLINICSSKGVRVFAGSEDNVLDRFYQVAKLFKPEHIVRITADCPLHDASVIDKVIEEHLKSNSDYTSNCIPPTYPDGLDVEIFTFDALERAWSGAELLSDKEHVTPFIRNNEAFRKNNVVSDIDYSKKRWTLDEEKDFAFINKIYAHFYPNFDFGFKDIIAYIELNKELEGINSDISRNEGFEKSLKKDMLNTKE